MASRRLITTQTLWTATAEDWPSFVDSQIILLLNDNSLGDGGDTAWNSVSPAANQILGPITMPEDTEFLDIEFFGEIATVTTGGASGTGGDIFMNVYGLPRSLNDDEITHPIADITNLPDSANARQGWISDGLCVLGHDRNANQMSHNEGTAIGLGNFPWSGTTMAAGERWLMSWGVARLASGSFVAGAAGGGSGLAGSIDVSGYNKIWVRFGIQNSSTMGSHPSAFAITATLQANLYERNRI